MKDFLSKLRGLSVERCEEHFFKLNDWSVLEWAGAAAGECGETANVAKKMKRMESMDEAETNPGRYEKLHEQLADEVADTIIYLDLLCASQGIDLEEAIRRKFNKTSEKYGYEKKL